MPLCLEFVVAYTHNEFQDFDLVLVSEIEMRANYKLKTIVMLLDFLILNMDAFINSTLNKV